MTSLQQTGPAQKAAAAKDAAVPSPKASRTRRPRHRPSSLAVEIDGKVATGPAAVQTKAPFRCG